MHGVIFLVIGCLTIPQYPDQRYFASYVHILMDSANKPLLSYISCEDR